MSEGITTHESVFQVPVDPSIIPWSYRGAYLCLATRAGDGGELTPGQDAYLISHNYGFGLPLFSLRPLVSQSLPLPPTGFPTTPSGVDLAATPSLFTWSYEENTMAEATFVNYRTIRVRGTVDMSFDTEGKLDVDHWRNWLHRVPPNDEEAREVIEYTCLPNVALNFIVVSGKAELFNGAPYNSTFKDNSRRLSITRTNGHPHWEMLIVEKETERSDPLPLDAGLDASEPFESSVETMAANFREYATELSPWGLEQTTPADMLASYVEWTSTIRPAGFLKSETVLMSKLWMNKIWSWDNCINGLALASASMARALGQVFLPFDHITPEGRLPDSIMRNEVLYDYTKPPIYGWTMFKLMELQGSKDPLSEPDFTLLGQDNLPMIYDNICTNTDFWFKRRRTSISKLPYYVHGNDSGWDNATCFDRQTVTVSPDLAAFLVIQADFLAKLAEVLGHEEQAHSWAKLKQTTLNALVNELWDGKAEAFAFKDAYNGETWTSTSLLSFMPVVAASYLPSEIVQSLVRGIEGHLTRWGLATEHPESTLYEPDGYWRGPVWAPSTMLLESGVRLARANKLADTIRSRFISLCEENGFAENFDAKTGQGNRDLSYTWTASVYLVFRREASVSSDGRDK
ncbi:Six-hairpin glycosidase-like protein [Kockovaella imperatae]|uniref:Six-hairpin glycosidase-like protein n=1 Tax=Kockovaella imperatae TaxID=4999 RepID=A0A1Y1UNP1_9TREE|nr:Six-hairpin glycosidase-like protein [Kockovaella imperatae]ORX39661.1 Six-hairpin glycosidase-like protein [Kockovaella imperatae]